MAPAKPSLELLRSLTDQHVLGALVAERQLTRAEIADRTGISKPTVGESVRRLTEIGLLRDTGERTTGRGRVGTYYALADDVGVALAISIAPEGVVAEAIDVYGRTLAREFEEAGRPAQPERVAQALRDVVERAAARARGIVRLGVVSAADPVDRSSGRLVHLPDAPFLVGDLSPAEILRPLIAGPISVDNDVNWAARAERTRTAGDVPEDFVYLYLGEGLGCAVVLDGEVRRGAGGLAGEIAHVLTCGRQHQAMRFTEVFAALGLRRTGSTAIDVPALTRLIETGDEKGNATLAALTEAITGVLAAAVAFADPQFIVVGGPWGTHAAVLDAISRRFAQHPRQVPIRPAQIPTDAPLAGARHQAREQLHDNLIAQRGRIREQPTSQPSGAAP
jgi:predicted NBD/HSP70 family sugar kinase